MKWKTLAQVAPLALVCATQAQTTPPYQFKPVPLNIPANALAFADFNMDGKQDAVGLNSTGIQVFLGNGDGTFATTPVQTMAVGSDSYVFSKSLIVTNPHNRNNPNPGVAFFASQLNASGAVENYGVITGDGKGDGSFGLCDVDICLPESPTVTVAPTPLLLVAGDFINNGNTDIAFAAQFIDATTPGLYDNKFAVFTGDGYGDFYPVTLPQALLPDQANATSASPSAQVADFANNSFPYLLVNPGASNAQGVTTLGGLTLGLNNHNGTFSVAQVLLPGVTVAQFLALDINSDNNLDIVYSDSVATGSPSTSIKAIVGDGTGNFASPVVLITAPSGVTGTLHFSFVDLDQDGNLDLVFSGQSNGLYWASGTGKGTFNPPALISASDTLSAFATFAVPNLLGTSTPFAWGQKAAYTVETGPQLMVNPSSIDFGSQMVGGSSALQTVTLTNVGTQGITLSAIAGSPQFAVTNGCGSSLAPGANCSVQIAFAPTSTGSQSGTLTLTDNAAASPQSVTFTGNGTNITVGAAATSALSSTISSGGTATYVLSLNPLGGFTGNVTVACSGAPSGYQCSASAPSVALNGNAANVTFTVSPAASAALQEVHFRSAGALLLGCLMMGFVPRRFTKGFASVAFLLAAGIVSGCGGSGGTISQPAQLVSSASYTLTAQFTTASGQSITQPLTLTINSK